MRSAVLLLLLAGCGSDAPEFLELRCTPASLSASGAGPFTVACDADFDGKPGDVRWEARGAGSVVWASGFDSLDSAQRDAGTFRFTMTQTQAPPVGPLNVSVFADHVDGIDGPEGDSISIQLQVVP